MIEKLFISGALWGIPSSFVAACILDQEEVFVLGLAFGLLALCIAATIRLWRS
jgi:hypothetical protein